MLDIRGNGYSDCMYDPSRLRVVADQIKAGLPIINHALMTKDELRAPSIVVQGKSGIAIAFAALMVADFKLIVVRKPGESTHGNMIEGPEHVVETYVILDDFVSSGTTVERMIMQMNELADSRRAERPRCIGIIQWNRDASYDEPGHLRKFDVASASGTYTTAQIPLFNTRDTGYLEDRCRGRARGWARQPDYNAGGYHRKDDGPEVQAQIDAAASMSKVSRDDMIRAYGGNPARVYSSVEVKRFNEAVDTSFIQNCQVVLPEPPMLKRSDYGYYPQV